MKIPPVQSKRTKPKFECFLYGPCALGDLSLLTDSTKGGKTQVQGYYQCDCIIILTNLNEDMPEFCPSHLKELKSILVC